VDRAELIQRLSGRRVCKNCGAVYHITAKPTLKSGVCDVCGGEVYQRADDKEDVIETRLLTYEKSTQLLKEYYQGMKKFMQLDGTGSTEAIFSRIKDALKLK
jgi:adenylate kinase